jgi:hypothetical protein
MNGKNVVTIDEDGVRREVEVETWMSANGMTEIVSGLNVWDKVVIQTRIFNVNTDLTPMMQQMQENRQQNRQFEQSMWWWPQWGTIMIRN